MKTSRHVSGRVRASLARDVLRVHLFEKNFTAGEVAALRIAWTFIEPKIKKISKNIAFNAYTDNPIWIDFFRFEGRIDGKIMILNPLWLLNIYGDIIKSDLSSNYSVTKAVRPKLERQLSLFLPMPHLAFLLRYVENGIYDELRDHFSPTTQSGFETLHQTMLYYLSLTPRRTVLYSEHYEIMDKFRDESGQLFNNELINHPIWLLRIYGSIIDNNVEPSKTKKILIPLIEKLKTYSMDVNCLNLQLDCIKKYICAELENILSPTLVEAFNKLHKTIDKYIYIKLN